MSRTLWLDAQFAAVQNDGDDLSITVEDVTLVLSGDLSAFLARVTDAVRLADEPGEDDARTCSRCEEEVSILNSRDECLGCEEERAQQAALEREGRESVRKGTALAAALAELDRDGYIHTTAGGNFRPQGTKPGKRLYSLATIRQLKEFIALDYTGYCTYGRIS